MKCYFKDLLYCFCFTIFVDERLWWLPFGLPCHNSPHQQISQDLNVEILSVAEYIYSNYAFQSLEHNHRMGAGTR